MSTQDRERSLNGGVILAVGLLLAAISVFDLYRDLSGGASVSLTILEHSLPLAFNLVLIVAGYRLAVGTDWRPAFVRSVTKWCVLGAATVLVITVWMYYFQILQGEVKPRIIFANVVTMGAVAGLGIGFYDGTRAQREEQLRTEHEKLSALFENSSDAIAEVEFEDGEPVVRSVNPTFERVFGFPTGEIVGRSIDEVIVPPGNSDRATTISDRAKRGEQFEVEVFRETASGEVRVFRMQAIPLDQDRPGAAGFAVYTDITEGHRYERRMAALHDATRELITAGSIEEISRMAVEAASDILGLKLNGIHLYDPATDALTPAAHSERVDWTVGEADAFERGEGIAWTVFETGEPQFVDDVHERREVYNDESLIRSEMLLPLGEWGVLMIGAESVDAFDESEYSLARILAANVESAMDRMERERELAEQNDRLERLASIVSHDLRNPLNVAQGYLELAREGDGDAFDRVTASLDRMDQLIEELLTLAREGKAVDEVEPADLAAVAREAWTNVATRGAELRVTEGDPIRADESRLQQLLENLFRNAVEHGGSDVTVTVARTDSGFAVEDDGEGIDEAERDEIFEHGYTTGENGTGIGLAIVAEIAEAHDWAVAVTEGESGGAHFEFVTGAE